MHTHSHAHAHMHTHSHTCTHAHTHAHTHTHSHTRTHAHTYHVTRTHTRTHISRYTHAHTNTHTHIHTLLLYSPSALQMVVSGSDCGHIFLWSTDTGALVKVGVGPPGNARSSPLGLYIQAHQPSIVSLQVRVGPPGQTVHARHPGTPNQPLIKPTQITTRWRQPPPLSYNTPFYYPLPNLYTTPN